ncbi:MAG: hypothetical protein HY231_10950 [Acidobacteria bacterium]|nr:hypothetical protein [Acidobacteriota bacterium]
MTSINILTMVRRLAGKTVAITLVAGIMAVASYAQSNNLYYQNGGQYYGRVTVIPGSHFEIETNGTVIKTFRNSCRQVNSNGVAGVLCTFGQFRDGRHLYSGQGYFFQNGLVYLNWTNENIGGTWRQINTGWYGFRP